MFRSSTFWILFVAAFGSLSSAVEIKIGETPLGVGVVKQDFAVTLKLVHEHRDPLYNRLYFEPEEIKPEYKFHVSIERNGDSLCSGAVLFNSMHVITAASCNVKVTDSVFVNKPRTWLGTGQLLGIGCVKNHPNYRFNKTAHKFDFDVAIITLKKPINASINTLLPNIPKYVIREGQVTFYSNLAKELFRQTLVVIESAPIISAAACRQYGFNLTENMLCVGSYSNQSFCSEDHGSPLFVGRTLLGIKSWGEQCSRVLLPSVYTNITVVRQWIIDTVYGPYC